MITFLIVLIFAVIIIGVWNGCEIRRMNSRPLGINELNDKHYWELKYKMQFLLTTFTLIAAIAAYFGITTIKGVEEKIRQEFTAVGDSLRRTSDTLKQDFANLEQSSKRTDASLLAAETIIKNLDTKNQTLAQSLQLSRNGLNQLKANIELLNENNKNQSVIYIIDNVIVGDMASNGDWPKIFFKDLKQANGNPLPDFETIPILFVASMTGNDASIRNVTRESFEIVSMMSTQEKGPYVFTLFITIRPFR